MNTITRLDKEAHIAIHGRVMREKIADGGPRMTNGTKDDDIYLRNDDTFI